MIVDQTGNDTSNIPASQGIIVQEPQQFVDRSDPLFEIDDEFMQSDIEDEPSLTDDNQAIVPRGRLKAFDGSPIFGSSGNVHNILIELPPSENAQALVPVDRSESIVQGSERPPKRLRIGYKEANAALETPTTFKDAINSPQAKMWKEAIDAELKALNTKKTWTSIKSNPSQKVIGTKWVFTIKRNEQGEIERYKARLVALGYRQTYGIDYSETYSPVANMNSIRVFLALCCHFGLHIHQYDVDTAFLNGHLEEEVFIHPPEGVQEKPNQVLKLNRSLYGLKQAAATWFKTISKVFKEMGFTLCILDSCIFVRKDENNWTYVSLYVDDMIIGAKSIQSIKKIADELAEHFQLKVLGNARFILGIEIDYDQQARTLKISQAACISRMVDKFNQGDSKPVYNPCVVGQNWIKAKDKDLRMDKKPYRSLIGSLLYVATGTRPDIAFSVCQLSRHLEQPSEEHWKAAIRVLKYLKTTATKGICYQGNQEKIQLSAYSDADWASNKDDRLSTSGIMIMISNYPVIFKSKLQGSVSLSTAEAEYVALTLCTQETPWTKNLLNEMKININYPVVINEDNQSAIAIAKNNGYQSRAKHIDIRYHFVREQVKAKSIELKYIDTKLQLADFLTKPISTKQFELLLDKSNIRNSTSRGSVEVSNVHHPDVIKYQD